MTDLREIQEEDVDPLIQLAQENKHGLWRPTHIIEKDGKMAGSISVGGVPLVTVFMDKAVNSPLSVREVLLKGQKTMLKNGFQDALVAVNEDSPAFRFMPALGFYPYVSTVWYKDFGNG